MTAVAIAFVQALYFVALYAPMEHWRLNLPRSARLGAGYIAANALALLLGYGLDLLGVFSTTRLFWAWAGVCVLLNTLALRNGRREPMRCRRSIRRSVFGPLVIALALSVPVRLADPLANCALPGTDAYEFVNFYDGFLSAHRALDYYPSGFAVVTAMVPWRIQPYEAARWAPNIVFLSCLLAAFGFWQRIGGIRFALALTFLLGAAGFLYPLTAYHPHFIQWTTSFLGTPALIYVYARLSRRFSAPVLLFGIAANFVFVLTSGYFALCLNAVLSLLSLFSALLRRGLRARIGGAIALASIPPLVLLGYYGLARRYSEGRFGAGEQARIVVSAAQTAAAPEASDSESLETTAHPLLEVIRLFLAPTRTAPINVRWFAYLGGSALALWIGWRKRARRHDALRLLAGVLGLSAFSAMTGIFELPGWQGRNVFMVLLTGLATTLWWVLHSFPVWARRASRSPRLLAAAAALMAVPSIFHPPMIGRNVPIADVIHPRSIPADNRVIAELQRSRKKTAGEKPLFAVCLQPAPRSGLALNLLRLRSAHMRRNIFRGYRLMFANDVREAMSADALLLAQNTVSEALPGFVLHTRGPDYLFFVRAAPIIR